MLFPIAPSFGWMIGLRRPEMIRSIAVCATVLSFTIAAPRRLTPPSVPPTVQSVTPAPVARISRYADPLVEAYLEAGKQACHGFKLEIRAVHLSAKE